MWMRSLGSSTVIGLTGLLLLVTTLTVRADNHWFAIDEQTQRALEALNCPVISYFGFADFKNDEGVVLWEVEKASGVYLNEETSVPLEGAAVVKWREGNVVVSLKAVNSDCEVVKRVRLQTKGPGKEMAYMVSSLVTSGVLLFEGATVGWGLLSLLLGIFLALMRRIKPNIEGTVLTQEGEPIPQALVVLYRGGPDRGYKVYDAVITDGRGRFTFWAKGEGEYFIIAYHRDYEVTSGGIQISRLPAKGIKVYMRAAKYVDPWVHFVFDNMKQIKPVELFNASIWAIGSALGGIATVKFDLGLIGWGITILLLAVFIIKIGVLTLAPVWRVKEYIKPKS